MLIAAREDTRFTVDWGVIGSMVRQGVTNFRGKER